MTTTAAHRTGRSTPAADSAPRLLRPLLRLDLGFNAVLALVVLARAGALTAASGLPRWPVLLLAAVCVDNAAVMWVGVRATHPERLRRMTRLTAGIDLAAAAALAVLALAGPAGMATWVAVAAGAIAVLAVPVAAVKLLLAAHVR